MISGEPRCSFCGDPHPEDRLAAELALRACPACIRRAVEILDEELGRP